MMTRRALLPSPLSPLWPSWLLALSSLLALPARAEAPYQKPAPGPWSYWSSIGFVAGKNDEGGSCGTTWLHKGVAIHARPRGIRLGVVVPFCEVDAEGVAREPQFRLRTKGHTAPIQLASHPVAIYEQSKILVFETVHGWARISAGWIALTPELSVTLWRRHFASGPTTSSYACELKAAQPLLSDPPFRPRTLVEHGTKKPITVKAQDAYILATKDDYALVLIADRTTSFDCPGIEAYAGAVGWIRYVDSDGRPLVWQVYLSC